MDFVTIVKDVALVGAAITGAIVAVKGLSTWKKQLRGQSEYELSKSILVTLLRYRDAIDGVRNPGMWAAEMPYPPAEQAEKMNAQEIQFYGRFEAYKARWERVQEQRTELYPNLLEAEAIWGKELKDLFGRIFSLEHELLIQVRHCLDLENPKTPEARREAIIKFDEKRREVLYDDLGEEPDEFKSDVQSAIVEIEAYLKPKLQHEIV